jgi:molecular chaperone IbpA
VTVKENSLTIKGKKADADQDKVKYLYRGIATRTFERRFELADHIKVTGAQLENGFLSLDLVREVPEAMKPRTIKIGGSHAPKPKVIEGSAA